jgi:hypothetical protein
VFSRAQHDFRRCPCGYTAVDGGRDCLRVIGNSENYIFKRVELAVTVEELKNDYYCIKPKLGQIPKEDCVFVEN